MRRGSGLAAVFLTRDRFAVLDKTRQLLVKNFQNEVRPPSPHSLTLSSASFPTSLWAPSHRPYNQTDPRVAVQVVKRSSPPLAGVDGLYFAGTR